MANVNAPRGLSPVGTITGAAFNEQGQLFAIATDASNTYAIGDAVKIAGGSDANGVAYVTKVTADSDTAVGVIVGVRAADPGVSLQGTNIDLSKLYLSLSSGTRYVYVVTDPNIVMEVQADSYALADVGKNVGMNYTTDQTSTLSQSSPLSNGTAKASTIKALGTSGSLALPLQVVGFAQRQDNAAGSYAKVLVAWNKHQYRGPQGTA
jgi:hypothetical protein